MSKKQQFLYNLKYYIESENLKYDLIIYKTVPFYPYQEKTVIPFEDLKIQYCYYLLEFCDDLIMIENKSIRIISWEFKIQKNT